MQINNDNSNDWMIVQTSYGTVRQKIFDTKNIKKGLKYTADLSRTLNDTDETDNLFKSLFNDKPYHHIEYLKNKLGSAMSHHNGKISGALYLSHNRIPFSDKLRFMNHLTNKPKKIQSINIAIWFIKWSFSNFSIFWMSECLGLDNNASEKEWSNYRESNIDSYFLKIDDQKLQKYVDSINEMRKKYPDVAEAQDSIAQIEWSD